MIDKNTPPGSPVRFTLKGKEIIGTLYKIRPNVYDPKITMADIKYRVLESPDLIGLISFPINSIVLAGDTSSHFNIKEEIHL